jgi:hypothetical protein
MPREFYICVLRENFRKRNQDEGQPYRDTVRWAIAKLRGR